MKLNHLSIPSTDFRATAGFFEKFLDCSISLEAPHYWILKRPGFDIVIEEAQDDPSSWPHNFHVGFEMPSAEAVRDLWSRCKAEGIKIHTDFFKHERGSRFFCYAPGMLLIEINTRADADEPYRGTFDD